MIAETRRSHASAPSAVELRDERAGIADRQHREHALARAARRAAERRRRSSASTSALGARCTDTRGMRRRDARDSRSCDRLDAARRVAAFRVTITSVARAHAPRAARATGRPAAGARRRVQRSALTSTRSARALHAPMLERVVEHGDVRARRAPPRRRRDAVGVRRSPERPGLSRA